jgi:hypothetical protein
MEGAVAVLQHRILAQGSQTSRRQTILSKTWHHLGQGHVSVLIGVEDLGNAGIRLHLNLRRLFVLLLGILAPRCLGCCWEMS